MEDRKITLKAARINAGLSQSEAAEKMGVNVMTVSNWETGKTIPDVGDFKRLCELYRWPENGIRI